MQIVYFRKGRDGDPITRYEGKIAFPDRRTPVELGKPYVVEEARSNPKGTVYFLRVRELDLEVEAAPEGEGVTTFPHVEAYMRELAQIPWKNPNGLSAAFARRLLQMYEEEGAREVVAYAHSIRHDNRLARGAFAQVLNICALGNLDCYGSMDPFVPSDLTQVARKIAGF